MRVQEPRIFPAREQDRDYQAETWRREYEQSWNRLPLGLRIHLARTAPRDAFGRVLADGSDEVLEAFLDNPLITPAAVLLVIDRARSQRLLERISKVAKWYSNHAIKRRLLRNPLTPFQVACRLVDYLPLVELQRILTDINLKREVRNRARESFRRAFMRLSDGETRSIFLHTEGRVLRELAVLTPKDKRVLLELLRRPSVPGGLVLQLARSHLTPPEILQLIGRNAAWMANAAIRRALVLNAKTPDGLRQRLKGGRP